MNLTPRMDTHTHMHIRIAYVYPCPMWRTRCCSLATFLLWSRLRSVLSVCALEESGLPEPWAAGLSLERSGTEAPTCQRPAPSGGQVSLEARGVEAAHRGRPPPAGACANTRAAATLVRRGVPCPDRLSSSCVVAVACQDGCACVVRVRARCPRWAVPALRGLCAAPRSKT